MCLRPYTPCAFGLVVFVGLCPMAKGFPKGRWRTGCAAPLFQRARDIWFWASSLHGVCHVGPCL